MQAAAFMSSILISLPSNTLHNLPRGRGGIADVITGNFISQVTSSHAGLMNSAQRELEDFADQLSQPADLIWGTEEAEAYYHDFNRGADIVTRHQELGGRQLKAVGPDPRFSNTPAVKRAAPRAYKKHPAVLGSVFASQLTRQRLAKKGQELQAAQQYADGRACAAPSAAAARQEGHTARAAAAVATAAGRAARRAADASCTIQASGRAAAAEATAPAAALSKQPTGRAAAAEACINPAADATSQGAVQELGRGLRHRKRSKRLSRQEKQCAMRHHRVLELTDCSFCAAQTRHL